MQDIFLILMSKTLESLHQMLPAVLKSAVQSTNTLVFVPSSFDFIRVYNYFRKHAGVSFTILSECAITRSLSLPGFPLTPELYRYSSNEDISRARQAFFQGKKSFLLVSERFHFYKRSSSVFSYLSWSLNFTPHRYKIRGIRNLIFYGPPDHPQFYTELLCYPFLDDGVDASDVTCRVLYSKYDWFRLERIAGTEGAAELIKAH